jgi:sugar lactone lactonase YvrE
MMLLFLAVSYVLLAQGHPMATGGNQTNTTTTTTSTKTSFFTGTTAVPLNVNTYSTTLQVNLNGSQLSTQTLPAALTDPTVQAALAAAQQVLYGKGASFGAPQLTSSTSTLQSSVTAPAASIAGLNLTCAQLAAGSTVEIPYGIGATNVSFTSTVYIGPQTINIGDNQCQTFYIAPGNEDIDTLMTTSHYVNPVQTNTYLVAQTYALNGTTGVPSAQLTPVAVAFPGTAPSATSSEIKVALSDPGLAQLSGISVSLGGTNASAFALTSDSNCGATLSAGSSCTIAITFTPPAIGNYNATLSVADNATGSPQTIPLTGIGTVAQAQLSPGQLAIVAGTVGTEGNTGAGTASGAQIGPGQGVAFDGAGNLYFSDYSNNTVWKVTSSGNMTAFVSSGLSTPMQIAFDASGNLYVADQFNQVIRKVNSSGVASVFAGNASSTTCGYTGDGAAATSASLCYPQGVAIDAAGNVYIADEGSNIVRKVSTAGVISLFAGSPGASGYSGDGATATKAQLNAPVQLATDLAGNVYIADEGNNVVRKVNPSGVISTYAGGGSTAVTTTAQSATAAKITVNGVATDPAGNLYITSGSSVYEVNASQQIALVAGGGTTMLAAGVVATQASVGANAIAIDSHGNLFVDDATNFVIYETGPSSVLAFGSQNASTTGAALTAAVTNTGTAALTISNIATSANFKLDGNTTTCSTSTALAAGTSCVVGVDLSPTSSGALTGTLTVTDNAGNVTGSTQKINLTGTGTVGVAPTAPTLTSYPANPTTAATAAFSFNDTQVNLSYVCSLDNAAYSSCISGANYSSLAAGAHKFSVEAEDTAGNVSSPTSYSWTISATVTTTPTFTVSTPSGSQSVAPGGTAVYGIVVAPQNGAFTSPITLSASGLPTGATAIFSINPITPGSQSATSQLSIYIPNTKLAGLGMGTKWLLLPALLSAVIVPLRRRRRWLATTLAVFCVTATLATLSGCNGGFAAGSNYNIAITATSGTTVAQTTVQLTVQQ